MLVCLKIEPVGIQNVYLNMVLQNSIMYCFM